MKSAVGGGGGKNFPSWKIFKKSTLRKKAKLRGKIAFKVAPRERGTRTRPGLQSEFLNTLATSAARAVSPAMLFRENVSRGNEQLFLDYTTSRDPSFAFRQAQQFTCLFSRNARPSESFRNSSGTLDFR